jgi:deoxyribodipyrimidine photo-lyase
MQSPIHLFWFRRDLRLADNAGLYHALKAGLPVVPIFIFDNNILDKLEDKKDKRVHFIHESLCRLQGELIKIGSSLEIYYGSPEMVFANLLTKFKVAKLFTNHDYEPYALKRDNTIRNLLKKSGVEFITFKDQVIFEKGEIMKDDGTPYTIFTPYSKKWKMKLNDFFAKPYATERYFQYFYKQKPFPIPSLESMGFEKALENYPSMVLSDQLISKYKEQRDFPGIAGTSRMSVHLRFGTISIRGLVRAALGKSETFLNELIWRDFYQMILWNFPQVGEGKSFKPAYDLIPWRNNEKEFERWCEGQTGYPIVDAGMRELNETGFMHNRVRMIVASFLSKHLLIDWRWGEAYFAQKLLDFDLAANNGGWQWAAGSGCDAAPYFRVFNPYLQTQKFDPELKYVRAWVPELEEFSYPQPMVAHEMARKRVLEVYASALKQD